MSIKWRLSFATAAWFIPAWGIAMGIFSELVLFSEVEGIVLQEGHPLEGVEIVQEITYQRPGKIPTKTTQTDADGKFTLERITTTGGLGRFLPGQIAILQRIVIRHRGVEYEGWRHTKTSYEQNGELGGRPLRLVCELSRTPDFEGKHYGICRVASDG